jgi:hypothetical protein
MIASASTVDQIAVRIASRNEGAHEFGRISSRAQGDGLYRA